MKIESYNINRNSLRRGEIDTRKQKLIKKNETYPTPWIREILKIKLISSSLIFNHNY
jgi:hypothetical protein